MSMENKIMLEITELVSRYCESQMVKPDNVYIQLGADKEGKLHVVSFDVTVSVDLNSDAKSVNKKIIW